MIPIILAPPVNPDHIRKPYYVSIGWRRATALALVVALALFMGVLFVLVAEHAAEIGRGFL